MSTLKTHNLQSPDANSANIALAPNTGMVVTGISTFNNKVLLGTDTEGQSGADDLTVATAGGTLSHTGITIRSATDKNGSLFFSDGTSGNSEYRGWVQYTHSDGTNDDYLTFGTAADERLRITSGGRVFIGETSVAGSANLVIGNGGAENFEFTSGMASTYEGGVLEYIHRGDGNTRPNLNYFVNNTGEHKFWTAGSERLRITSGGGLQFRNADTPTNNNEPALILNHAGGWQFYASSDPSTHNNIIFGTNSVAAGERLRIDSTGRVLVNTTTTNNGNNKMIIEGPSPSGTYAPYDGQLVLKNSETSGAVDTGSALVFFGHDGGNQRGSGAIRCLKENGTSGNHNFYMSFLTRVNGGSNTEKLRIASDGKVKIGGGTASLALLHIAPADYSLNLQNNSNNKSMILFSKNSAGNDSRAWIEGNGELNGYLAFAAGDNERLRIKSDGIIEMGTSIGASSDANLRLRLGRTGDCFLGIRATGNTTSQTGIKFGDSADEDVGVFLYDHYNERFQINVDGNTRIYIDGAGDIFGQSSNSNIVGFMGAKTTAGTTDWNHATNARSGNGFTLLLGNHSNGPGGSLYYHAFTFEYAQRDSNGNMTQLAIPYNGGPIYSRYRYGGSWSGWQSH